MQFILIALAAAAGFGSPIQSAANAGLNKALGTAVAGFAIYAVALLGLLVSAPFLGFSLRGLGAKAAGAPWWVWVGGLFDVLFVLAGAVATRRVGSAVFTVTTACCAVVLSIVLDWLGVMGLEPHPLSWLRVLGGAMAVGGIILVSVF